MKRTKYKLRCRDKDILVTSNTENYNVVWKREYYPKIYPLDRCKDKT